MEDNKNIPAIFYAPEGYITNGPKLMGRHVAGATFLEAFIQYVHTDKFYVQTDSRKHAEHFLKRLREAGRKEAVHMVGVKNPVSLEKAGLAYYPGPGLAEHAWSRSLFGHAKWSLCGLNHTIASARAMQSLTDTVTAPLQPWDALICTSKAAKESMKYVFNVQFEYLQQRMGAQKMVLPQLPVIPLGVNCADFQFSDADKAQARATLGFDSNTVVVLFVGRLSFHAKANPFPMYVALQNVARQASRAGKKVALIELGWFANDGIRKAFEEAGSSLCSDVHIHRIDGTVKENRTQAWASADIFCSLSDNIQESFGITPVEAMAAGIPAVVSDWDGYKDTIVDGETGFRIKTAMPYADEGLELTRRHALEIDTYDMYCGYTSQTISVDVDELTQRLFDLVSNADLRKSLGKQGRQRALAHYDWQVIMTQYQQLWQQLGELRAKASEQAENLNPALWPARLDPFKMFGNFATELFGAESQFKLLQPMDISVTNLQAFLSLRMVSYTDALMAPEEHLISILKRISLEPETTLLNLQQSLGFLDKACVTRSVGLLLKLGLIRLQ